MLAGSEALVPIHWTTLQHSYLSLAFQNLGTWNSGLLFAFEWAPKSILKFECILFWLSTNRLMKYKFFFKRHYILIRHYLPSMYNKKVGLGKHLFEILLYWMQVSVAQQESKWIKICPTNLYVLVHLPSVCNHILWRKMHVDTWWLWLVIF